MEKIIFYVEKGLIAAVVTGIYLLLVCSILPRLTLKLEWQGNGLSVRGIRRVVFPDGRGVVYEPDPRIRRYIRQYAIYVKGGDKYVRCSIDPRIKHLRYDVISFTSGGKMLDILSVDETVRAAGTTVPVCLPTDTAYAYIVPRRIDKVYKSTERVVGFRKTGMIRYAVVTALATVVMSVFLYDGLNTILDAVTRYYEPVGLAAVLFRALLFGAAVAGIGLLACRSHTNKVINK